MPQHVIDAHSGHNFNMQSGLELVGAVANIEAVVGGLESCEAITSFYTQTELSASYAINSCNGVSPTNSTAAFHDYLTCSHSPYYGQQSALSGSQSVHDAVGGGPMVLSALSAFQAQFNSVPGLSSAYFLEGITPLGLSMRLHAPLVAPDGFVSDSNLDLMNGTWFISSVGAPYTFALWLNLNQSLATARCLSTKGLPGLNASCTPTLPLFVMPSVLTSKSCSEGVYADYRGIYTQYLEAERSKYTIKFVGLVVSYSVGINIHTALLGGVLAAVAALLGHFWKPLSCCCGLAQVRMRRRAQ